MKPFKILLTLIAVAAGQLLTAQSDLDKPLAN